MEFPRQRFIACLGAAPRRSTLEPGLDRKVEDQRQVGPEVADGHVVERAQHRAVDAVAVALIGHGGVGEAVGHDPGALPDGGQNRRAQMLAARREVQQRLGHPVPALGRSLDQQLADHLGARRTARLARGDAFVTARLDQRLEAGDLGRLAGPFSAFQRDEEAAGVIAHDSQPNM